MNDPYVPVDESDPVWPAFEAWHQKKQAEKEKAIARRSPPSEPQEDPASRLGRAALQPAAQQADAEEVARRGAAPTLHEVRSLSVRLYDVQGGVDTQALAGHSSADMTAVYADPRGVEAVLVKVHRR